MRTGAERENLLLSDTRTILRACSTMARDISDLANVEIEKGPGLVDRRCPDHREVDTKLFNLPDGDRPDNAAVALSHGAAGEEDFDGAASVQFACDMQVIGDDQEAGMSRKRFGDLFRRRADIDEKR